MSTNITHPPTLSKSGPHRTNALPSGYVLDEYRIEVILGAGGFGITYKALDTHLNAWVAIKEYFPVEWSFRDADGVMVYANTQGLSSSNGGQTSDYEWGLERFLDEARVLARIQHPYIVRVKRYFRANGTAYIVMEYEDGEPLNTILDENGTLGEDQLRGLLEDVLPALQAVHEQGYLHRDIKPANLYVRARDHRVMLIDFGAARAAISRHSQNVTSLVTPGYSPPEQYTTRNDRYGRWTDLYALGAVLYRCVTGHTPAEAAERLLDDHLEPAVVVGAGRYSTNILRAIDRVLAVRPEMRFRDVAEMQAALAGSQDDDSDETVLMAPVPRIGKTTQESAARPMTQHPPAESVAKAETVWEWPESARPAVESPRSSTGRREVLSTPAVIADPPPRRAPVTFLAVGAAAVVALALGVWLWPSAPESPPAPHYSQDPRGQPPPVDRLPSPPVSGASESAATSPLQPVTATLPVSPATPPATPAAASASPPPIVETTGREPAPAEESGTRIPAGEPPAPLLGPNHQAEPVQFQEEPRTAQPVQFQEEPRTAQPVQFQEEPRTGNAPEPVTTETPALAPGGGVRPRSGAAVEGATTKPDAGRTASAREARPIRSKTARPKDRRGQNQPKPIVVTPVAPVRSAPATHTSNPWESPASTGFNQK